MGDLEGVLNFFNSPYPEESTVKINQENALIITPNKLPRDLLCVGNILRLSIPKIRLLAPQEMYFF